MPAVKTVRVNPVKPAGLAYLAVRSLFRYFVTGQSVTGRKTDNASFLHAATKDERGKPVEKLTGPIWHRLARRWAIAGFPALFLTFAAISWPVRKVGEWFDLTAPLFFRLPWVRVAIGVEAASASALAWFGLTIFLSWWKNREKISEFVYPTWEAACGAMGVGYHKRDARRMVELPEGFEIDDEPETGPGATTWFSRLVIGPLFSHFEAKRLLAEAEQIAVEAAAADTAGEVADTGATALDPAPSTALELWRPRGVVARFRGRRLDVESQTPEELPEPPPVRIKLFPGKVSTDAAKKQFVSAVTGPLGMPDIEAKWFLRGRSPFVELRPRLAPPPSVSFSQIRRHLNAAGLTNPFMGLAAGNKPVGIDLDNNSPHTMISGGSGTGKSVMLKNFLAQRMHHGSGVLMLDYKRVSHRWLHNLPGCEYAWRLGDIHDKMCAAGEELGRRLETVLPESNDIDAEMTVFPTLDIVVEEINSTIKLLQAYWTEVLDGKGTSPAVTALMTLVNMGREYRMYVWIAAQRASASVFGANGGDLRESFQTRLMAKWSVQTWKMLAGNAKYQRPIGGRGVWARVQDDEVEVVRVPFWTNAEARDYALSGVSCPTVLLPNGLFVAAGRDRPDNRTADIGPQLVTLSAALKHLPPDSAGKALSISGLRSASRRPGFPAPLVVGGSTRPSLYDLDELIGWRTGQVGETAELTEMFEQPARPSEMRRRGIVYLAETIDPESGTVENGYVGQTRRTLAEREAEHRGDKAWSDLIVGSFRVIWEGEPTDEELDAIERRLILELLPRYNVEHQKGAAHAMPKWQQIEQRHARDDALGRPRWIPVDVFSGERRPEQLEEWRRDETS